MNCRFCEHGRREQHGWYCAYYGERMSSNHQYCNLKPDAIDCPDCGETDGRHTPACELGIGKPSTKYD